MSVNNMFYPKDKEFTKAEKRAFAREELVYNVTEDILVLLEDMGISKKDLANKLGKSPMSRLKIKKYVSMKVISLRGWITSKMSKD